MSRQEGRARLAAWQRQGPFAAGDPPAVVIDKGVLEAMDLTRDTRARGSTHGDVVLYPVRDKTRSEWMMAISDGIFTRHAGAFRKLGE
jgi:hypothetical protein